MDYYFIIISRSHIKSNFEIAETYLSTKFFVFGSSTVTFHHFFRYCQFYKTNNKKKMVSLIFFFHCTKVVFFTAFTNILCYMYKVCSIINFSNCYLVRNFSLESQAYKDNYNHHCYSHTWPHFDKACLLYMGLFEIRWRRDIPLVHTTFFFCYFASFSLKEKQLIALTCTK